MAENRSNFYKNPGYGYKKDLGPSSALQNLQAYKLACGQIGLDDLGALASVAAGKEGQAGAVRGADLPEQRQQHQQQQLQRLHQTPAPLGPLQLLARRRQGRQTGAGKSGRHKVSVAAGACLAVPNHGAASLRSVVGFHPYEVHDSQGATDPPEENRAGTRLSRSKMAYGAGRPSERSPTASWPCTASQVVQQPSQVAHQLTQVAHHTSQAAHQSSADIRAACQTAEETGQPTCSSFAPSSPASHVVQSLVTVGAAIGTRKLPMASDKRTETAAVDLAAREEPGARAGTMAAGPLATAWFVVPEPQLRFQRPGGTAGGATGGGLLGLDYDEDDVDSSDDGDDVCSRGDDKGESERWHEGDRQADEEATGVRPLANGTEAANGMQSQDDGQPAPVGTTGDGRGSGKRQGPWGGLPDGKDELGERPGCTVSPHRVGVAAVCEDAQAAKDNNEGGAARDGEGEGEGVAPSEEGADEIVRWRRDQRFPVPGEPACAMCGRYGAYICDQTEADVCSLECKGAHFLEGADLRSSEEDSGSEEDEGEEKERERTGSKMVAAEEDNGEVPSSMPAPAATPSPAPSPVSFVAPSVPRGALPLPDLAAELWDPYKTKWKARNSSLSTYRCWKCNRPGHLADDCTVTMGIAAQSPTDATRYTIPMPQHEESGGPALTPYTPEMRAMYKRCCRLQAAVASARCTTCDARHNLAHCLDCNRVYCDGSEHLTAHLRQNTEHTLLYSYKLRRQVKCCKASCPVSSVYDLHVCPTCLSRTFDQHYNMYSATWSAAGLKLVANILSCDDHFQWHRANCVSASDDATLLFGKFSQASELSEFIF